MYDGTKVCIKCLRVTKQTRPSVEKVFDLGTSVPCPLKEANRDTGILQGSDHVEEVETSERRSLRRCHEKPLTIYI